MRKSALYVLGLVVAALVALGLVVLFSASEVRSVRISGQPWHFVARQAVYIGAGLVAAAVVAAIDYRRWRDQWVLTVAFSAVVIAALWVVFLFPAVKGSHRWIPLPGGINFQPGEFAKLVTVLAVAVWMDRAGWRVELLRKGALCPAGIIGLFAIPVLLEPDFGSVMVIASVGFMTMFVAGARFMHLLLPVIPGIALFAWEVWKNPNRMARLFSFAGASAAGAADPAAYQSDMSIVAISRGGWFGRGLNGSMQKQYYLPEAWTDFILAVGAEEMGLVFSVVVILLFVMFFFTCVYIARKSSDRFGRLLALGMSVVIFFQAMFNIGVVCEAFPTKGMALPFFSYGGTNMVPTFMALGFIFSVGIHSLDGARRRLSRTK